MKSFYEFRVDSPQERSERNKLYPELARFHIALREELSEEEYQQFYQAEQVNTQQLTHSSNKQNHKWITA
jgi:hypothetical protein